MRERRAVAAGCVRGSAISHRARGSPASSATAREAASSGLDTTRRHQLQHWDQLARERKTVATGFAREDVNQNRTKHIIAK
eukprot:7491908-Pyramimonas_sp.AAC.1